MTADQQAARLTDAHVADGAVPRAFWSIPEQELLRTLDATPAGLSTSEAHRRLWRAWWCSTRAT
jgi:hypothetical protein